ncbi:Hermansky-Pudlak syndrome 3 protein isoform X2 [Latimeria chalumnae]|uniref:Hermansky-Pudlak syndrome 3 protein isoform X2 n=1 Tax=Latimeria chalumnae TaxID=7897 RepID=UPI0003C175C8|nr:PREDICTED: Hermansky-Pudlak syndrome 3 protein isoform X2 [Latimeria chalumnae]|eukprot:XP_006007914.1 PREDICTED: Hermansky-Pudlak syndrome 3 protein isoform X2 [Latimeria chalumnae]
MVQLYNCHPFASQQIVQMKHEPDIFCCGGDALFVVCAGGCNIDVFALVEEGSEFLCSFATVSRVQYLTYSEIGDYLVTIEEKNKVTSLYAYINWRCQALGKSRVSVRMVGHVIGGTMKGTPKDQMEIVEMPLAQPPQCMACCPITGDLLVGYNSNLVIFSLKQHIVDHQASILDFERFLILHLNVSPRQVAFCAGYVAIITDLEAAVIKLESAEKNTCEPPIIFSAKKVQDKGMDSQVTQVAMSQEEQDGFVIFRQPVELLGTDASTSGLLITLESTGLENEQSSCLQVCHILYRQFAPDYSQISSAEETSLHSLQLVPMYYTGNLVSDGQPKRNERKLLSLFCFFSLPHFGYLYNIKSTIELISTYQYPDKSQQVVLSPQFLHVITRNSLQCFTVRCSAVAARDEDPYVDTTLKACPPVTMGVCALRIQLFIGLQALCHFKNHIILLTKADGREGGRGLRRKSSKMAAGKQESEPGWNLYIVNTVPTIQLYNEMVEYCKKYETANPQSYRHLLSEAHMMVRAALMDCSLKESPEKEELMVAFRESCAKLGDTYCRADEKHFHLALPYYRMSSLTMADIVKRGMHVEKSGMFGNGFMFCLRHLLQEEITEVLSEETAANVLYIFSVADPHQLPHVVCSPCLKDACPGIVMDYLQKLEDNSPSIVLTLTKAAMALKMKNLQLYGKEMERHAEMMMVWGFIEEPRLLLHRTDACIIPTEMALSLKENQSGLMVASVVALHENSKLKLDEADHFFSILCKESEDECPQILVDFWEALLVACPQEVVIQELLFKLAFLYIQRIIENHKPKTKSLKTPEDLINSCTHYGLIFPWVNAVTSSGSDDVCHEEVLKLQSLLCGPTLKVTSIVPFLEHLPEDGCAGLSIHVLCDTRLGEYEKSIDKLLDRCPEAVIPYANHELQQEQALWWKKLLPELCRRTSEATDESGVLVSSLKETLSVLAMKLEPLDLLNLFPEDGIAAFFLPHLLECSRKKLLT